MAGLVGIVRPFQSVDITPPRRVIKEGETAPANVILRVEGSGQVKVFSGSESDSLTYYMTKRHKEKST